MKPATFMYSPFPLPFRWLPQLTAMLFALLVSSPLHAQVNDIELLIERAEDVGFEGHVRPGTWAPMRAQVRNKTGQLKTLMVDWVSPDADGDQLIARRENVVVAAGGSVSVRLYAMPAMNRKATDGWTVRAIDKESEQIVASIKVTPKHAMELRTQAIGLTGGGLMGLASFRETHTQHEPIDFITGIDPATLPDRWYGMQIIDALVWTPVGGRTPVDPSVPLPAIKEWVRRGGHLIIVLSSIDSGWSDPRVADLLPAVNIGSSQAIDVPRWMYETSDPRREPTRTEQMVNVKIPARMLSRRDDARPGDVALITPGSPGSPGTPAPGSTPPGTTSPAIEKESSAIASHQFGFGRVTLIGIDLTDRRLASQVAFVRYGLPRLWQTVFGWRSPGNLDHIRLVDERKMMATGSRAVAELGTFIPGRIAMKATAAVTVFGAVVLFGIYWVVAGPAMFATLKSRKILHHSWLVFAGVVVFFSAVAWLAAAWLRPGATQIEHFSIVDIDSSQRGPAQMRAYSVMSLFVPEHGNVNVAIADAKDRSNLNALASPGLPDGDRTSFVGERRYSFNTLAPSAMPGVPMRSTAKQFEAHYCDIIDGSPFARQWSPPTGGLKLVNGWPSGRLTHDLPGTLTNIRLIYSAGDGKMAEVWNPADRTWRPGQTLVVSRPATKLPLVMAPELVTNEKRRKATERNPRPNGWENRSLGAEGLLGAHMSNMGGRRSDSEQDETTMKLVDPGAGTIVITLEMLSFFSMLPPPDFMLPDDPQFSWSPVHFSRRIARGIDLTKLTAQRRLIILGHIETDSPAPVPMTVDGGQVKSKGWTMVRFVMNVED